MDKILLSHGSGGRLTHQLIDGLFVKAFDNPALRERKDSALVTVGSARIAFTTDSYVVQPLFFPGGDIGSLAVYGTVNDLSVCGATPLCISCAVIIEEGLEQSVLRRVTRSIAAAARRAKVSVVTGDTKVVEKGACDRMFITTSGIGRVYREGLSPDRVRPGDVVIVSGPIGDHAVAVLSKREGFGFGSTVRSDSQPLNGLTARVLGSSRMVRFMRDPTRGGLATTLNEVARGSAFGIALDERDIPVRSGTRQACELLGLDPLYLACEGRVVIIVAARDARRVIAAMRADASGALARVIGRVTRQYAGKVYLNTVSGGRRVVDMLTGEQLPRIC